jgi:hypothetical protein
MSEETTERLYNLLPAIYRIRDKAQREPLRALLAVIETELQAVEEDIGGLYENQFIETCDEWVVPYIGDLLGVHGQHAGRPGIFSLRAFVANTLAYRRGKGTVFVLEGLARDVTGWDARAVEFFELIGATQHANHVRPHNLRTPDLRDRDGLELLDTAFDTIAHTPDVRRIATGRGKYNIPNVGLFLWRLQSYFVKRSTARAVSEPADGRYTFDPLGKDMALFNRPQTKEKGDLFTGEIHVPGKLRRGPLHDELEARRQALKEGETPKASYFGAQPVLEVYTDGETDPLPAEAILICDLGDWDEEGWTPPASVAFASVFQTRVAVDPVLGRLAFLSGVHLPGQVEVSHAYGFSGDVGGGPYNRLDSIPEALSEVWQVGVSQEMTADGDELFDSLAKAVEKWHEQPADTTGVIAILDSRTYSTDGVTIQVPEGSHLMIVAADWPEVEGSDGTKERTPGHLVPAGLRPHLSGDLNVKGTASSGSRDPGKLTLDGFLIEGKLTVAPGNLGGLGLAHCTLVPGFGGLYASQNAQLGVEVHRSTCDAIVLTDAIPALIVVESIVDQDVRANGAAARIEASTVMGKVSVRSLEASNSIFVGNVTVKRRQAGWVRYCYVSENARVGRRFRCQPQLEIATRTREAEEKAQSNDQELSQAKRTKIRSEILRWLKPTFTSKQYGRPGYAQLARVCPQQIWTGAEDGAEMGVFNHLMQPQREANLRTSLDEYLRFGLEAGIIYVT